MTVVIAYSPDEHGEAALAAGIAEAEREGDDLVVVNATKGDALVDPRYAGSDRVLSVEQRLKDAGVRGRVSQSVVSDVGDAVVEEARRQDARLIVVGIRHRSPVGKALMGSVAQRVILDATVPVLCVKATRAR